MIFRETENDCREVKAALVECARRADAPNAGLKRHMAACPECGERFAAECELTSALRGMQVRAQAIESRERPLAWANREDLMRDFAWRYRRTFNWSWALAAAAALVVSAGIGHELAVRSKRPAIAHRAVIAHRNSARPAYLYQAGVDSRTSIDYQTSHDAGSISGEDFIAVPFAPPLATGELVTLVRTSLAPEELASMGIDVDDSSGNLSADVVVGEDGIPRAVRITETSDF